MCAANRIYEGQRLKALFRSYLKLNAGESFFHTLQQVGRTGQSQAAWVRMVDRLVGWLVAGC